MSDHTLYTGTDANGTDLLLTVWDDGTHELATRRDFGTWGPPVVLVRQSDGEVCS